MSDEDTVELQEAQEHVELGADDWLARMRNVADVIAKMPTGRTLQGEEVDLFISSARRLAEMFLVLDEKLCSGFMPPRAWSKEVPEPGQLPTSELHRNLKAEPEVIVQKILMLIEQKILPFHKTEAPKLMTLVGKLLSTLALFTSESVRLACLANIKPEPENNAPHLALVHDADPTEN